MNLEHAQLSMNVFDAIIIGVFCLSAVVAFFRGFLREVLSLVAWVGAAVITIYLFPQSTMLVKQHVKSEHVAAGAAALGTYFAALVTLSLLSSIIIRYLKTGAEVGIIDNALGFVFGAVRGAFIVSLAYLLINVIYPSNGSQPGKKYPEWLQTSVTKPYLEKGADMLMKVAPHYLSDFEDIVKKQKDKEQLQTTGDNTAPIDDTAAKTDMQDDLNGTRSNTRKAMDSLLNDTNPTQEGTR